MLKPIRSGPYVIVPIHYSYDPSKDDDWVGSEKEKYIRKNPINWEGVWNREMEMDFTSVAGAIAYPAFSTANLIKGFEYSPSLPICLAVDFNIEPMVWEVAQIFRNRVVFIDEIKLAPGTIEGAVREFRNRYPSHQGELWIYGDAMGRGRNPQTGKTDYDLMRLYFRGYSAELIWKVPLNNPPEKDRLNAVNLKLKGAEGQIEVFIDLEHCPELVQDFREVVTKDGRIVKSRDREDPYYQRTHASDASGYLISREWPTVLQLARPKRKRQRQYRNIFGELR